MYKIYYTADAKKDYKKISQSHLRDKIKILLEHLSEDPFFSPPPCKKLRGMYKGMYSRRINHQHRLFYMVSEHEKTIKILRMWTHYGEN